MNGIPRPRCKRQAPPQIAATYKCSNGKCGTVDADGDINVDGLVSRISEHFGTYFKRSRLLSNWPGAMPSGMPVSSFNPRQLLNVLCPGGLCPGQKNLDPALNSKRGKARTGSL